MSCNLINAESLSAWFHGFPQGGGILTIEAKGHAECPGNVKIMPAPLPIEPPEFDLESCPCARIGSFPYTSHASFNVPYTATIVVNTAAGPKTVKVKPVPVAGAKSAATTAPKGEATGYAPNSTDISRAYFNAIDLLRQQFPTGINAEVTKIGFFATGSPVGIAATYVTVKQQGS